MSPAVMARMFASDPVTAAYVQPKKIGVQFLAVGEKVSDVPAPEFPPNKRMV